MPFNEGKEHAGCNHRIWNRNGNRDRKVNIGIDSVLREGLVDDEGFRNIPGDDDDYPPPLNETSMFFRTKPAREIHYLEHRAKLGKSSSPRLGNESSGDMVLNITTWAQVTQGIMKGALREEF